MFERFTTEARTCVIAARERATVERADGVEERHLLAALLDVPRLRGMVGFNEDAVGEVLATLQTVAQHGGLRQEEVDALAGAGIDPDAVVARVRAWHKRDARGGRRRPVRRRRRGGFTRGTKAALEQALRQGIARRDRELRSEHLLLGLLAHGGPVADVMAEQGVTAAAVHAALDGRRES